MHGLHGIYQMQDRCTVCHMESHLVCLETVLVSVQDMCMVCAYCTMVEETILKAPIGTSVKGLKSKLRLICLEIVLI